MKARESVCRAKAWVGVAIVALLVSAVPGIASGLTVNRFNRAGNILIADQFNNRVLEVSPSGKIVWRFGTGGFVAGAHTVVAPNDVERIGGGMTLISGTGAPAGTPGYPAGGAIDSRVMIVNHGHHIVWQYGKAGISGSSFNELNAPVCSVYLGGGRVLITDQGNQRVIIVNRQKAITWQYGQTGVAGVDPGMLNNPNSAELLRNGRILIADENNNRVIEVTKSGTIKWQYGSVTDTATLNAPAFASRLPNGNTLISDSLNNRIVEVTRSKAVVWTYVTNVRPGSVTDPIPTRAIRLANGNTVISDQFNHQVIVVNKAGAIVRSYGHVGVSGSASGFLNAPYDAKVIGTYFGLTRP
jgi:hypothetical protein